MPEAFTDLPTPLVADACMRCGVPLRAAHPGIRAVVAGQQIWQTERDQARRIQEGHTLRKQTAFVDYMARRAADPSYTFRQHLRRIGGAIEE